MGVEGLGLELERGLECVDFTAAYEFVRSGGVTLGLQGAIQGLY